MSLPGRKITARVYEFFEQSGLFLAMSFVPLQGFRMKLLKIGKMKLNGLGTMLASTHGMCGDLGYYLGSKFNYSILAIFMEESNLDWKHFLKNHLGYLMKTVLFV